MKFIGASIFFLFLTLKGVFAQECPEDTAYHHQLLYVEYDSLPYLTNLNHDSLLAIYKIEKIDSLLRIKPENKEHSAYLQYQKSLLCQIASKYKISIISIEKAMEKYPRCPDILYQHAQATSIVGSYTEGLQSYKKAAKYGYDSYLCDLGIANCKYGLQDHKAAIKDYDILIQKYPEEKNLQVFKADALIERGKFDEAKVILTEYKDSVPNNPELYLLLSVIAVKEKDIEKSVEYYTKTVELDDNFSDESVIEGIEAFLDGDKVGACQLWRNTSKLSAALAKSYIDCYCPIDTK